MANLRDYDRSQRLLLPPDLNDWIKDDDLAHFIVEVVERIDISAFHINRTGSGIAQYHPRMMLALLIYCYANGIFSSRRIERATYRDVGVRFVAANSHPDHDTIAKFRRDNASAFKIAFEKVLLLASQTGLLKIGTVSLDGTKLDANASKIKSIRYDRIQTLRKKLGEDIAQLMKRAEMADQSPVDDGQSLPEEIARREILKQKLDAAAKRLEDAEAEDHDDDQGNPPLPNGKKQTNLTDPDSTILCKSKRHEFRQAYNGQAAVDADGTMLVLANDVINTSNDRVAIDAILDQMESMIGLPTTLLADTGYAGKEVIDKLEDRGIEALIAIGSGQDERPYDFRPPPVKPKKPKQVTTPWRLEMMDKLKGDDAKAAYKKRQKTVEPVFGIIKSVMGFTRFTMRGLANVKAEWMLVTLAWNCKRLNKLMRA